MKKITLMAVSLMYCAAVMGQVDDPVLMKVDGKAITRGEFEYSFNKNNADGVLEKKTVEEYVPLYVNFKLKVAEALHQRMDTIASVRKELDGYKEQFVVADIVDSAYIEREARRTYDNTASRFGGEDLLEASHILVMLRQDATPEQQLAAKTRIDSIYDVLKNVAKDKLPEAFAHLAESCSDDKGSAQRGGFLGQFGKGMMIPDFEKVAYSLKAEELSSPFKTPVGYHIIYLKDRHPFEPYEYHRDAIMKFLDQRGIREASANAYIDSISEQKGLPRGKVVDDLLHDILAKDADKRYLSMEYHDGTLMYEVAKKDVWDKAQKDTLGIDAYFKANKKRYAWKDPRFIGVVVHAKDAATLAKAKKLLKGVAVESYATTLAKALNTDSVKLVRITKGLFKQGDDKFVDREVFKQKVEPKSIKDYPATAVFGKKLKKPRSVKDVQGQVVTDYQDAMEQLWVEQLRKIYPVEVDENVLKTVNKH